MHPGRRYLWWLSCSCLDELDRVTEGLATHLVWRRPPGFAALWILYPSGKVTVRHTICSTHSSYWRLLLTVCATVFWWARSQVYRTVGYFCARATEFHNLVPTLPFPIAFEFWAYFWHSLLDAFCWGWKSSKWNLWKLIVLLLCDSRKRKAKRIKASWRNLNFFRRSLQRDCTKGKSRGLSAPSVSFSVSCLLLWAGEKS